MSKVRLIDANALKDAHIECPDNISFFDFGEIVERFLQTIDEQPTVDAVHVVRCKDCKHRFESIKGLFKSGYYCEMCRITSDTENCDDFYCADGEAKHE